jgi:hypothetical protein
LERRRGFEAVGSVESRRTATMRAWCSGEERNTAMQGATTGTVAGKGAMGDGRWKRAAHASVLEGARRI